MFKRSREKNFVPIIETALPEQGTLLERNFFPEAGKPLSRNYRDFAGAAWALSRISLMPGVGDECGLLAEVELVELVPVVVAGDGAGAGGAAGGAALITV